MSSQNKYLNLSKQKGGNTPEKISIFMKADIKNIERMLQSREISDINITDTRGNTVFMEYTKSKNRTIYDMKQLINRGANIEKYNKTKSSALEMAVILQFADKVEFILNHLKILGKGNTEICGNYNRNKLIKLAEDVSLEPAPDDDPIEIISTINKVCSSSWVLTTPTPSINDFFRAVESQDSNAIEEIINQGININEKNSMGQTALIYASEKGFTQIVNILLKHEANAHIIDTKGKNALMYAVELNHTSFIASLVDKMEPTAREITYRERIKNLNPYFLAFLNSERPDFTNQLRAYINSDHDYLQNINDFVISNCNATDNILIIDFDNIAYNTIERQSSSSSSSLYTLPTNGGRTTTSLLPNVTDNEMISYKSAVLLVLRYARENQFTNVIAITKNPQFLKQFKQEYNELKTNGKITITQNKNGTIINSVFNDMDLQTYLSSTKVSVISVESKIDSIQAPTSELGSLLSVADFKDYLHRLKGTDDSLIILISKAIKQNFTRHATVMSDDGNMIRDFKADYTYTCPFLTKIHVNSNLQSEFVVNFTNDYLALIETQIINNQQVTDNNGLFTRVIKPSNDDIKTYYYSVSTRSGTGFDVRNWYSRSGSTIGNPVINARFNEHKPSEAFRSIQYIDTSTRPYMPVLNPSGKPYLSQDGTIAKLKNNPTIPYLTETWNNTTQTYTYTPAQDNNRNYYTNTNNNNQYDTIEIFDEQPYAKKYISTNNSSGEHVEYYQKYMKYKAKYNELKEKLGL